MRHDDTRALVGSQRAAPAREPRVEISQEARAIGLEGPGVTGREPCQRVLHALGDRPRVLGVEPVVRVAESVDVHAALGPHAGGLGIEQRDASRHVEVGGPAGHEPGLPHGAERPCQPGLVVESDAREQHGGLELGEGARLDLHAVRVVERWRQAHDAHADAADRLGQGFQIRARGDDGQGVAAPRGGGAKAEQRGGERAAHYDFLTKTLLGTMQCTPLRTSTTWLTRQSPTMEVREYAS